jgi:beta-fructofuranosidase
MALRLTEKWVWDFWLARDGTDYHVFYLQAPRSLVEQQLRHLSASIGHAVSKDLENWRVLPDALHPGPRGAWDEDAVWTGSVVRRGGTWHMFYTGVRTEEGSVVQRVGSATSTDLTRWRKITARAQEGPPDGRGVIGHARSRDLAGWETLPPLTEPGHFYALEVPQLVRIGGRYYLLFSTWAEAHSAARRQETRLNPVGGTHYLVAEDPLGPFRYSTNDFLVGDPLGSLYSGKVVEGPHGRLCYLAWRNFAPDGAFVGELVDPLPIAVDGGGNLYVPGSDER